jgi:hypothetical protein
MKNLLAILFCVSLVSCNPTKLVENWKNPDYEMFNPKNILVIGVTPNIEARKDFEFKLVKELNNRKINALGSAAVFERSFQDAKQTELDIEAQVDRLLSKDYDAVLVSLVKGREENKSYAGQSVKTDYFLRKFTGYYFVFQDAYFNQDYYKNYKVFHIETSLYSLKRGSEKSLVWYGTYDLVNPSDLTKVIDDYVQLVIKALEKRQLIPKKV